MTVYDFTARTIAGQDQSLADFRGQVLLIVNVASKCGYTPQYQGLEALHRKLGPKGLVVLGFPCDQFGNQEPGTEAEIMEFCGLKYDVTFPMFAKIEVNGEGAHALFQHLKAAKKGILGSEAIKWNFTKFLVDRNGTAVARYGSRDLPEAIEADILPLLDELPRA
ncbi:MAG: glutathione peroxidase [Gemmatimonadales bacterium]